jgi:MFS superfamily sulfate permease-like transporter
MSPHAPHIPRDLTSDLLAGFVVALVALPLCLAIALASGFPPFAGVLTAIVGGLVPSLLGSAPLTIKGPAAGLIVIVLGSVETLGAGTAELGVRRTAALVAIAGCVQIALGLTRAGKVAELVPAAVVHGMLAAIGVLLVAKQGHVLLGVKPAAHTPAALLAELPAGGFGDAPVYAWGPEGDLTSRLDAANAGVDELLQKAGGGERQERWSTGAVHRSRPDSAAMQKKNQRR